MKKAIDWVKTHKLVSALVVIIGYLLFHGSITDSLMEGASSGVSDMTVSTRSLNSVALPVTGGSRYYNEAAPTSDITDRKVVLNSTFSLLVKNVIESIDSIKAKTTLMSGYMVNMGIDRTDYGDTANIQVRIPSEKVDEFSKYLRGLAVKVVSENIDGRDITDQYVDVERRLADLEKQRARFEVILNSATTVTEMMEVQRQIFVVQDQIDSYKGQILYMDGSTKTSKLTIYVSTDELSLPYSPARPWRPEVVLKQAVRSMLTNLQGLSSLVIWGIIYIPLVILAVIVFKVARKILKRIVK